VGCGPREPRTESMPLPRHARCSRFGRVSNANPAEHLVPGERRRGGAGGAVRRRGDPHVNRRADKGVAEIAICRVAPVIAIALYRATRRRVSDLPITPEKLL
jgi:xanthine dehydrogenase YagR molybdenum-binding subunit